jgi:hypothetical protein
MPWQRKSEDGIGNHILEAAQQFNAVNPHHRYPKRIRKRPA